VCVRDRQRATDRETDRETDRDREIERYAKTERDSPGQIKRSRDREGRETETERDK